MHVCIHWDRGDVWWHLSVDHAGKITILPLCPLICLLLTTLCKQSTHSQAHFFLLQSNDGTRSRTSRPVFTPHTSYHNITSHFPGESIWTESLALFVITTSLALCSFRIRALHTHTHSHWGLLGNFINYICTHTHYTRGVWIVVTYVRPHRGVETHTSNPETNLRKSPTQCENPPRYGAGESITLALNSAPHPILLRPPRTPNRQTAPRRARRYARRLNASVALHD